MRETAVLMYIPFEELQDDQHRDHSSDSRTLNSDQKVS